MTSKNGDQKPPEIASAPVATVGLTSFNTGDVVQIARAMGLDPAMVANDIIRAGVFRILAQSLEGPMAQAMASDRETQRAVAQAAQAHEDKKPDPDDLDPMTPEERLQENRRIARGEGNPS